MCTAVIGLQWGDEGKGKTTDFLAEKSTVVARFNGGANAGHTIVKDGVKFKTHLLPCGVLHKNVANVIGNGVAVDPEALLAEIDNLARIEGGMPDPSRLKVSHLAHVIFPWHKMEDRLNEAARAKGKQIGTTARGIGPLYSDKCSRTSAIRICDLIGCEDVLREKINEISAKKQKIFSTLYGETDFEAIDPANVFNHYRMMGERLKEYICNTGSFMRRQLKDPEASFLYEGGQGVMLDLDAGSFPFCTSSCTTSAGIASGLGISYKSLKSVVGILKAYCTRVGGGPFPTEQDNETGDRIRIAGNEFGTTTGRPRRCGWLDLVAAKYACEISGVDKIVFSLFDVLNGFEEVRACTAYYLDGVELDVDEFDPSMLASVVPKYKDFEGWELDLNAVKSFEDFPPKAKEYVNFVSSFLSVRIDVIGIGPGRHQSIKVM